MTIIRACIGSRLVGVFLGLMIAMTPAAVQADPIAFSADFGGLSVDGSANDLVPVVAADCLPTADCRAELEREFLLAIDAISDEMHLILIPELSIELLDKLRAIEEGTDPRKGELLFEELRGELGGEKESVTPALKIGIRNPVGEKLKEYESSTELGANEKVLYKGRAKFERGYRPKTAALIIYKPGIDKGYAVLTPLPVNVPEPSSLLLLGLGVAGLCGTRSRFR